MLGVIARLRRLDDGRRAVGVNACQQDRAFHLRARDFRLMGDRVQRRAVNRERRTAVDGIDAALPCARADR
jgi:hypothetical protein